MNTRSFGVMDRLIGEIDKAIKMSDRDVINRLYLLAFCRLPAAAEIDAATKLMHSNVPGAEAKVSGSSNPEMGRTRTDIEDLYWAVLTSREFVFNH